jgi:hypothetical protein
MAITPQDRKAKSPKVKLAATPTITLEATPTSAKDWKKASTLEILDLPSGNKCRLKRPGLPQLLAENVLPDMLTPIASKAIEAGQNGQTFNEAANNKAMAELMETPEGVASLFDGINRLTAHCVVEPTVLYHRRVKATGQIDQIQESYVEQWEDIPQEERNPDDLYTDEVDDNDKFFIFQFVVGGTRDLERFRQELSASVESMESIAGSQVPTE